MVTIVAIRDYIVCFLSLTICVSLLMIPLPVHSAVDNEALAEILLRKGVLSPQELRTMRNDAQAQEVVGSYRRPLSSYAGDTGLPTWVTKMKWSGDMRIRYESLKRRTTPVNTPDRNRFRIRARYGFSSQINDQVEMGLRLASGSSSPTSTNITLANSFEGKNLALDRAYIKYSLNESTILMFGKFGNPFYSTDLVFDKDLSFDGFSQIFTLQNDYADYYLVLGEFPLEESANDNNVIWMYGAQIGVVFDPRKNVEWEIALSNYRYTNIIGASSLGLGFGDNTQFGASLSPQFRYLNAYNIVNLTSQMNFFFQEVPVSLMGDYARNIATDDPRTKEQDEGYQVGVHLGKAKAPKTLEVFAYYKHLDANAVLDFFTDSDFGGGGSNVKGYKFGLKYQLLENTQLGLTYFDTQKLKPNLTVKNEDTQIFQVDMNVKF